jgi:oxygen-independent coproporphyrinogen-3 oxidase
MQRTAVSWQAALEESFFLGLRLTRGVNVRELERQFGDDAVGRSHATMAELVENGWMEQRGDLVFLTSRGRLLSNEVFERFILTEVPVR